MKLTERPVEPKKEKVLEITESEFTQILARCTREALHTFNDSGAGCIAELRMMSLLLSADICATVTTRLFGEENNK